MLVEIQTVSLYVTASPLAATAVIGVLVGRLVTLNYHIKYDALRPFDIWNKKVELCLL